MGSSNWITGFWTNLWGKRTVAANEFRSGRKMILSFHDQDYIIYKTIGTEVKMQKRKFGIWFNTNAQDIRLGWSAIDIEGNYSTPPIRDIYLQNFVYDPKIEQLPRIARESSVQFLNKNFPFGDNWVLFSIDKFDLELETYDLNKVYGSLVNKLNGNIKAFMNEYSKNQANNNKPTPKFGAVGSVTPYTLRYLIGANEEARKNRKSFEMKFYSKWFDGTYGVTFSARSMDNFISTKNIKSVNLKGSQMKIKRGSVYGAVKYEGKWLGARINVSQ